MDGMKDEPERKEGRMRKKGRKNEWEQEEGRKGKGRKIGCGRGCEQEDSEGIGRC